MPHKIAIIKSKTYYPGYGDDGYETITSSITDWEEVSDEDFKTLSAAGPRLGFTVIEQPLNVPEFVAKTVADYKHLVAEDARQAAAEKKRREDAALARKLKKEQKAKESKLEMFKRLQAELGINT